MVTSGWMLRPVSSRRRSERQWAGAVLEVLGSMHALHCGTGCTSVVRRRVKTSDQTYRALEVPFGHGRCPWRCSARPGCAQVPAQTPDGKRQTENGKRLTADGKRGMAGAANQRQKQ